MSSYLRASRVCAFEEIQPQFQDAFREYLDKHGMADPGVEAARCCETISHPKPSGWLPAWLVSRGGDDQVIHTVILLTSQALVWAREEQPRSRGVQVVGARLADIRVRNFASLLNPDNGLEVTGLVEDARGAMHGYIGLGPEPEAERFCEEVAQAVEKINPSVKRKFPLWMGGGS